ncbi:hypothetical protein N7528_009820 [Penicillium herquei]|nr:hypothetical protein N7528_009820 [Penicillium herquei]
MPVQMQPSYMPAPNHLTMNPWHYVMQSTYPSQYAGTPEYNAPPSLPGSSALPYFICLHCGIPRSTKLIYESVCVYCLGYEQKYCMYGEHEEDRRNFYDRTGVEQVRCNDCRGDDEDEQLPEAKKETAPESSDDSDESDTDLSDASSDVIQLNALVNAQQEPQRDVQKSTQPDVIFVDAPKEVQKDPQETVQKDPQKTIQKDPQETVQANTKTGDTPKEVQPDAQGNQPGMVLVDVQGDDILLSDVPGDVHESPQVDAQADTANLKTGEEKIAHKKSPEPSESVKIKIENDDSVQLASISHISAMPVGGDNASDPILID